MQKRQRERKKVRGRIEILIKIDVVNSSRANIIACQPNFFLVFVWIQHSQLSVCTCVSCVSLFVLSVLPVFQLLLLRLYILLFFAAAIVVVAVQPGFFVDGASGGGVGADVSNIANTHTFKHTHIHTLRQPQYNSAYSLIWKMIKAIHHCFTNANFIFIWL